MNVYKRIRWIIGLVCAVAVLFSVFSVSVVAGDGNTVTATTSASLKQGSSGICYVYIDSTEGLAALDVTVHFDPAKVKVNTLYNSVSCTLYDSVKSTDTIQFSYILDGKGTASKTRLFYFSYQVLSNAEIGDAYFDITVGEAYDNSLNDVAVSGSRFAFSITETVTNKTCSVSSTSSVSTAVEKEFSLSYRFSTYQLASGSAVITYDPELFEVVQVTNGAFLSNKIADVNTELAGAVYLSFVGTEYNTKYDLVTVTFRTIKNVAETSNIVFKATELCDVDLNPVSCNGYTTAVTIGYDETYVGDAAEMSVNAEFNEETEQVVATIALGENSRLGAGDFVLNFDPTLLTLVSYEKGFSPTFFNVNDKGAADGVFKFSIISLEDIVKEETVITLTFDVFEFCEEQDTTFEISGSMLTDSLTESIVLKFVDGSMTIPKTHACISGDINGDGIVNNKDLGHLQRYINGWDVTVNSCTADVDDDGEVNNKDFGSIQRYVNGWDIELS